eukprot:SAG22_NODE_1685_length_3810_cov_28.206413_3_plen_140_part_00
MKTVLRRGREQVVRARPEQRHLSSRRFAGHRHASCVDMIDLKGPIQNTPDNRQGLRPDNKLRIHVRAPGKINRRHWTRYSCTNQSSTTIMPVSYQIFSSTGTSHGNYAGAIKSSHPPVQFMTISLHVDDSPRKAGQLWP